MLRYYILFGYLLLSISHAFGQSRSFDCDGGFLQPAEQQSILGQAQKKYTSFETLAASFDQESYLAALSISEASRGSVKLQKPGSMKWIYTDPEPQTFLVDKKTVWLYQPQDNQVVIDNFDTMLLSDLPVSFLMGLGNLKEDFTVLKACKNRDGIVFELKPNRGRNDEALKSFYLLLSPDTFLVKGGKVTDVSGNVTSIVLKNISTNTGLTRLEFTPNFPQGTDITDRRKESAHG